MTKWFSLSAGDMQTNQVANILNLDELPQRSPVEELSNTSTAQKKTLSIILCVFAGLLVVGLALSLLVAGVLYR